MNRKTWLALALLCALGLTINCKDKVVDDEKTVLDSIQVQSSPEIVLSNFKIIYNFAQNGIDVEAAISKYYNCFSNDSAGPQYEFIYRNIISGLVSATPDSMSFAEEMAATAALFREVAQKNLNLKLSTFGLANSYIEMANDTLTHDKKHPGEDWYVYEMYAYLTMGNPNPASLPYLVTGNGLFYVRRCADGNYRIVRWVDKTYEAVASPKSAMPQNLMKTSSKNSWGNLKSQFSI